MYFPRFQGDKAKFDSDLPKYTVRDKLIDRFPYSLYIFILFYNIVSDYEPEDNF